MDCSPPGSSLIGILQARILEWVAVPFSRGSSWPRGGTQVSHTAGRFFTIWTTREPGKPLVLELLGYTAVGLFWPDHHFYLLGCIFYLVYSSSIWTFLVSQVLRPSLNDSFSVHIDLQSSNQIYFSNQNFHQKPYSQPLCIACITLICIWSHDSFNPSIDKYLFSTLISNAKLFGNLMISHWRRD